MTPSPEALALLPLSTRQLRERFAAAHPVAPEVLAGRQFRGISLGLPAFIEALTWKTFVKAIAPDGTRGWNQKLVQTGLHGPIEPKQTRAGLPLCFGHFALSPTPEGGTLLDYGGGGNAWFDPTRLVRDPLVALRGPDDPSLLLGFTWLQLGPWRLHTPSWFVLEDAGPVVYVPPEKGSSGPKQAEPEVKPHLKPGEQPPDALAAQPELLRSTPGSRS